MAKVNKPSVFVSFSHSDTDFVDCLEPRLSKSAHVIRWEEEVSPWGSFKKFMDTIQEQDFAVLVVSDAYLKSEACMYEVIQAMSHPRWKEKTIFALMQDCKSLSTNKIMTYMNFWLDQYNQIEANLNQYHKRSQKMEERLETTRRIKDSIGDFLSDVADSRCPPVYTVIEEICARVGITPKAKFSKKSSKGASNSMKGLLIKSALCSNGPMTIAEISKDLGIAPQTTRRYTQELLKSKEIKIQSKKITSKGTKYLAWN